ncbi:MAG: hypothetical protein J1E41_01745 [Ruminococcus sp.]|nr:hypothetical protein [Ruminococcus sp.]
MKKFLALLCGFAILTAVFSGCSSESKPETETTEAKTIKKTVLENNFVLSRDSFYYIGDDYMCSSLLFAGDRYVYSNKKGIYVKKDLKNGGRKISENSPKTEWSNGAVLSDGKIVYYVIVKDGADSVYEYEIYSVGIDGKNEKKVLSGVGPASLITVYDGNLYFKNGPDTEADEDTMIMRYKLGSEKDPELVSQDYEVHYNTYYNGKIYFSSDLFYSMEILSGKSLEYPVYALDLESKRIDRVVDYSYGESIASVDSDKIAFYSRKMVGSSTEKYVYTVDKNGEAVKSKKLPTNADALYVDKDASYALMCDYFDDDFETFLKFDLKSGKQQELSKAAKGYQCEICTSGLKPGSTEYFVTTAEGKKYTSKVAVQKVKGDKAGYCKLGKKKSVEADSYWITDDKLVIEYNNKMKVYDLK